MSNSPFSSYPKTADDWFVFNQRDDLDEDDYTAFLAWLDADEQNEVDYAKAEQASAIMREVAATSTSAANENKRGAQLRFAAIAAAVLALIALPALLFTLRLNDTMYFTAVGEQREIALEDGSLLRMNTATRLQVKFDDHQRLIALETGEAYFDIEPDPAGRAFVVVAGEAQIRAVGTEFNILNSVAGVTVDVLEGVVEVGSRNGEAGAAAQLSQGGQITVARDGDVSDIKPADARRINAWRDGRLEFASAPLSEAIAEFNRYSDVELALADSSIGALTISGSFTIGHSRQFAHGLEDAFPVKVIESRGRILLHDARKNVDASGGGR